MKRSVLLTGLIAGCVWFSDSAAQVVVAHKPVIYRPRKVVIVKPAPVLVPARPVVVVHPRPVIPRARVVMVAPVPARRRVIVYR